MTDDQRVAITDELVAAAERLANPEASAPSLSDIDLAQLFEAEHFGDARYVPSWGQWLRFNGTRWFRDDVLGTLLDVRRLCADQAHGAKSRRDALAISSRKTVNAVEGLARAGLSQKADYWDRDRHILNTPGGVVALPTGEVRPNCWLDFCTKQTAVAPAPEDTKAPLWQEFLDRITGGDGELIDYLGRAAGYCLTGDVSLHALFFAHGGGANGKSVFIGTLAGIMGDYATTTPIETLTASHGERHPTELADLAGARLVVANETERGRAWAESRLKMLTGGDPIKARLMRQDFFQFEPQFKLWISGNHKPKLRGVDEAMRRRINLIPFGVTIPEDERDPELLEKLKDEWPAILRWAIDCGLDFRRRGLDRPTSVRTATDDYFLQEDSLGQWLEECCYVSPDRWCTSKNLFASWKLFCEQRGERPGSQKLLANELENRGFRPEKRSHEGGRGWVGLRLTEEANRAISPII